MGKYRIVKHHDRCYTIQRKIFLWWFTEKEVLAPMMEVDKLFDTADGARNYIRRLRTPQSKPEVIEEL